MDLHATKNAIGGLAGPVMPGIGFHEPRPGKLGFRSFRVSTRNASVSSTRYR
ncbi:hypothetical protein [Mycobacterium sp. GA-1841]|uniref:hypothetical protein n=1 Tax=Mycobacterium sp. GA-1841 TaxID=1834154 RepID=UPI001C37C28E|nr:hypothetical protein [Mycobacterium sp. GA-1841]